MPYFGPSESQSIAEHGHVASGGVALYRSLREGIAWYRAEWQGALPSRLHEGWSTVEPDDALGTPAWSERFRRYLLASSRDPVRSALAEMARGGLGERVAARFLFRLACLDFDLRAAGLAMGGCEHEVRHARCEVPALPLGPEYVGFYADRALARLRERMERLPQRGRPSGARIVERPAWMDRAGVGGGQGG
jgi:hypothetical protein